MGPSWRSASFFQLGAKCWGHRGCLVVLVGGNGRQLSVLGCPITSFRLCRGRLCSWCVLLWTLGCWQSCFSGLDFGLGRVEQLGD